MVEGVFESISNFILNLYNLVLGAIPPNFQIFVNLFALTLIIVLFSIFIWKFYRFVAAKNFLGLDLNKYNRVEHPFFTKLLTGILFLIEYIIVLPFLIFFWFTIFTLFLAFLAEGSQTTQNILVISAMIVSAIRVTSYYKEEISDELAKMLPFTFLAVSILTPGSLNAQNVIGRISEIPVFFDLILKYLIFIITLEIILRFFDFIFSLFGLNRAKAE